MGDEGDQQADQQGDQQADGRIGATARTRDAADARTRRRRPARPRHRRDRLHRRPARPRTARGRLAASAAWPGTRAPARPRPGSTTSRSSTATRPTPDAVRRRCDGVDVAYYLIHCLGTGHGSSRPDRHTARDLRRAPRASAGVRRHRLPRRPLPRGRGPLARTSTRAREVGEILLASGVPTTVLRAAVILGSGSASFEMLRYLTERLPVMVTPRWVRHPDPADRDPRRPALPGRQRHACRRRSSRAFDIGGPEVLTYARDDAAVRRRRRVCAAGSSSPSTS